MLSTRAKQVLRALLRDEIKRSPGESVLLELNAHGIRVQREHPLHEPPVWYIMESEGGTLKQAIAHAQAVLDAVEQEGGDG